MKIENKRKIIEHLEYIETENDVKINKLKMELDRLKEDQDQLIHTLLGLKSKVKNDEEEK